MMRILTLCTSLVTLSLSVVAMAQNPGLSVVTPHEDPVAGDHAEATVSNPAGLIFGDGLELSYTYVTTSPRHSGEGHSLMLSAQFADAYTMGVGYERLRLDGHETLPTRWSWSHGLRIADQLAIGLTWDSLIGGELAQYEDIDLVNVGVQWRPLRWLAFGALGRHLNRPTLKPVEGMETEGETVERTWLVGASMRPGTERVQVSGFGEFDESNKDWSYGARLWARIYGGFSLIGRYDARPTPSSATPGGEDSLVQQVMVGLSTQFGPNVGLYYFAPNISTKDGQSGMALNIRTGRDQDSARETTGRGTIARVTISDTSEYTVDGFFSPEASAPFMRTLRTLHHLAQMPTVDGVLMEFQTSAIGWAQAQELIDAMERLKSVGKRVYAWVPVSDTRTYAIAASAHRILTTPAGGVLLTGVVGGSLHIKGLLDLLGVRADFVTTGDYKTFPETFTRESPSDASTEVQEAIVGEIYDAVVAQIAAGREKTPEVVRRIIDDGPYTAERAREAGLVDRVIHYDEFETLLKKQFGERAELVPAAELVEGRSNQWGAPNRVAVLYITGTITDGPSSHSPLFGAGTTGSQTVVRAAETLREDDDIDAVVVRVDSPGGSVTAADAIWRSMTRLAEKKPLVVSFGDVAASGGYYVAAPGSRIFAQDTTITGSIGVFTGKFELSGLYEKLGVNRAAVTRGARADILADYRAWTDEERAAITRSMNALYEVFLNRVLAGRRQLNRATLVKLAGGRVWTGRQARERQLVDEKGGLLDAMRAASEAAGLPFEGTQFEVWPEPTRGFSLPSTPLGGLLDKVGLMPSQPGLPRLLKPLETIWRAGILQFSSGTPLALLPWIWERED